MCDDRIDDLVLVPSLRCNMRCEHCCRSAGPWHHDTVSDKVLERFADLFDYGDGCRSMCTSGGEPFLLSQATWDRIFGWLDRIELDSLYVATNGAWTQSARKRLWFHSWWVPRARNLLTEWADMGVMVEWSNDQFHADHERIARAWADLKAEAAAGYVEDLLVTNHEGSWDSGYFEPYDDARDSHVSLSERHGYIQWGGLLPLGRARTRLGVRDTDAVRGCGVEVCGSAPEEDRNHTLTVWPDGRVSSCCDGGAWIGNVLTMDAEEIIANQNRLFDAMLARYPYRPGEGWHSVNGQACVNCTRMGRRVLGRSFKEVQ